MKLYTDEFWKELGRMVDADNIKHGGWHSCRDCGVVDGAKRTGRDGKIKAIVRLALIEPQGPANDINNVGYYCTVCRKGTRTTVTIPARIKRTWPTLFDATAADHSEGKRVEK